MIFLMYNNLSLYKDVLIHLPWIMTKRDFKAGDSVYWNGKYHLYQRRHSCNNIYVGKIQSVDNEGFILRYLA